MVFFTCNACGQAVKKNQVEKHYKLQCRNCQVLSCMDCGKDFHGDDYMGHTKCISENEKYGGKEYKPKANANKGEVKQEEWITSIQNTIDTTKVRPALSQLLKQIMTFNNIPRNEIRFKKFLENSFKVREKALIKESWEIFNKAKEKSKNVQSTEKGSAKSPHETVKDDNAKNKRPNKAESNNSENHCPEAAKIEEPMTKKHKKAKKNKDMNNHIDKENQKNSNDVINSSSEAVVEEEVRKKHKKRKRNNEVNNHIDQENQNGTKECTKDSVNSCSEAVVEQTVTKKHKKAKKNKDIGNETVEEGKPNANISVESSIEDSSVISNNDNDNAKKKFNWKKVIKAILKNSSDNEISLKKLQKKVLAEYYARGGEQRPMNENELRATFRKKVTSNPKFKVHKERVKLVS